MTIQHLMLEKYELYFIAERINENCFRIKEKNLQ